MTAREWADQRVREIEGLLGQALRAHRESLQVHQNAEHALQALAGAEAEARELGEQAEDWARAEAKRLAEAIARERAELERVLERAQTAAVSAARAVLDLQGRRNAASAVGRADEKTESPAEAPPAEEAAP
jgi:signal transduction protein with GAF and PtsI domain